MENKMSCKKCEKLGGCTNCKGEFNNYNFIGTLLVGITALIGVVVIIISNC